MGMRQVFADGVSTIFSALGDIVQSATYKSITETYDASTRVVTKSTTSVTIDVILDEYSATELRFSERLNDDQSLIPGDKKAMVKGSDLSSVTPKVNDEITIDSVDWQVKAMKIDPAGAMYTFQIRRP